ncbi:MAG TPA: DUF4382 domain-containing protein [Longimicrobiales bacterium]
MSYRFTALVPALAFAALAACDQGSTGPSATGNTTFRLSQGSSTAAASLIALDDHGDGDHGDNNASVPLADIKAIDVRVTGIAALPLGNDSLSDDQWFKLSTPHPMTLNLLALPTKADSGLLVTRGNLPAGTYGHLRILFDTATITFARTDTLGHGKSVRVFKADSTYPLFIGGFGMPNDTVSDKDDDDANHFGIVVPATTFTVSKDTSSTISIVFNPGASVRRVLVTGHGLRLAPVIFAARHEDADSAEKHGSGHHD